MSATHLFIAAIGPVQSFIGAARRMRDLAYGSRMLSELAANLAGHLKAGGHTLIFPAQPTSAVGTTNKIVCVLKAGTKPAEVVQVLHRVMAQTLADKAGECLDELGKLGLGKGVLQDTFSQQMTEALDIACAWAAFGGESGRDYGAAYVEANALLDARKHTRPFEPNPAPRPGAWLSSLDGLRESVFADGQFGAPDSDADALRAAEALRTRLGVGRTEQLDAIGLVKRTLGRTARFPAVCRIALQPWVASWAVAIQRNLADKLQPFQARDLARKNGCKTPHPMATFPWDGELLLASRRRALGRAHPDDSALQQDLEALDTAASLLDLPDDDALYYALLVADGDEIGKLLASPACASQRTHSNIAAALGRFAKAAQECVQVHGGSLLYAGGDDVLAALPVPDALRCAEDLRKRFADTLRGGLPNSTVATLSVGVAFVHVQHPLGDARRLADEALLLAKNGHDGRGLRDALGVFVQPRHGGQRRICGRWQPSDKTGGIVDRLDCWVRGFAERRLSGSLPYDLTTELADEPNDAVLPTACRLLERRGVKLNEEKPDSLIKAILDHVKDHWRRQAADARTRPADWVRRLADEWYVARWLAGQPGPTVSTTGIAPADMGGSQKTGSKPTSAKPRKRHGRR